MDWLEKKMKEIGESVKNVEELIQEFEEFETKAKVGKIDGKEAV